MRFVLWASVVAAALAALFWAILCHAVRQLAGDEAHAARLADLVIAMSQLPDVEDAQRADGTPAMNMSNWDVYWRGLP